MSLEFCYANYTSMCVSPIHTFHKSFDRQTEKRKCKMCKRLSSLRVGAEDHFKYWSVLYP